MCKRVLASVVGVLGAVVLLSACGGGTSDEGGDDYDLMRVHLRDGRMVECIKFGAGNTQMMSCDWVNAK